MLNIEQTCCVHSSRNCFAAHGFAMYDFKCSDELTKPAKGSHIGGLAPLKVAIGDPTWRFSLWKGEPEHTPMSHEVLCRHVVNEVFLNLSHVVYEFVSNVVQTCIRLVSHLELDSVGEGEAIVLKRCNIRFGNWFGVSVVRAAHTQARMEFVSHDILAPPCPAGPLISCTSVV